MTWNLVELGESNGAPEGAVTDSQGRNIAHWRGTTTRDELQKLVDQHNADFVETNWIPGAWWRVTDPYGTVVYSDVHEDKARALVMDGYILERNYVCPSKTKWEKVTE